MKVLHNMLKVFILGAGVLAFHWLVASQLENGKLALPWYILTWCQIVTD